MGADGRDLQQGGGKAGHFIRTLQTDDHADNVTPAFQIRRFRALAPMMSIRLRGQNDLYCRIIFAWGETIRERQGRRLRSWGGAF